MTSTCVIKPARLAHIVLRSARFEETVQWWKTVLGAEPRYENDFITFLTYDDEHHRLAIVSMSEAAENVGATAGLEHVAFAYDNLDDLLATYERLVALDIHPIAPIHHGMTLSLYYADPDGTRCELQVDVMTAEEAEAFMASETFAANPIGIKFDPDDLVARRAGGESVASLLKYTASERTL